MALSRERVLHIGPIFIKQLATRAAFPFLLTQQRGERSPEVAEERLECATMHRVDKAVFALEPIDQLR